MAAAEARERAERDAARRRALESVPAKEEWELEQGGRTILFRRIAPPDGASETAAAGPAETEVRETENPARRADRAEPVHVDFRATVYLDGGEAVGSEVTVRRAGAAHRFWTNLDFRLLRVVGSFGRGDRHYSYFGFAEEVRRTREAERSRSGARYESRWKTPPVAFAADAPEYAWAGGADDVPEATVRAVEDLLAHIAENRDELETARRNATRLGKARRKLREANPPRPEDTVINFYPLSERKDGR